MLLAFDDIMQPLESEQICSNCKKEYRQRERQCAICESTFFYPDPKSMDDLVKPKPLDPDEKKMRDEIRAETNILVKMSREGPWRPRQPT